MTIFADKSTAIREIKADRLMLAAQGFFSNITLDNEFVWRKLLAAEKEIAHALKVRLEPTKCFSTTPTSADVTALAGKPYIVEPGYDYDPEFFRGDRWGYLVTRQHPILSVDFVRLAYPNPTVTFFTIPNDWLRIDFKYGHIRMVPASSAFNAPLGAFVLQAIGGGSTVPGMIQVQYRAGLDAAGAGTPYSIDEFPDLVEVIYKRTVLNLLLDTFPTGSGSISADGLSQSFGAKIQDYEDMITLKLYGPKGANGGLWTQLHGVVSSIIGTLA